MLGNGIWKNRYGSDPSVIGRSIKVNSLVVTVIGVMAPDMKFPFNTDLWIPLSMLPPELSNSKRGVRQFQVMGRLKAGVTLPQARAELQNIEEKLAHDFPDTNKNIKPNLLFYNDSVTGPQITLIFWSLMGAVGFVLLIACANVANLLLARSAQRTREIAVRVSLGASRWRIVRQLLVESILLSIISGALGLGLALGGIRIFDAVLTDQGKPYWMKFTVDPIVIVFLAGVCVATAFIFGLAPALHVSKTDVNEVMKEGGGRSGTGGMRARRWTGALIVAEVVLTLVLLAGAGFMMRSFLTLYRMDMGFDSSHLLTMRLTLPLTKYPQREPRTAVYQRLEERLRGVRAIQSSGADHERADAGRVPADSCRSRAGHSPTASPCPRSPCSGSAAATSKRCGCRSSAAAPSPIRTARRRHRARSSTSDSSRCTSPAKTRSAAGFIWSTRRRRDRISRCRSTRRLSGSCRTCGNAISTSRIRIRLCTCRTARTRNDSPC